MPKYFVDTWFFIALFDRRDSHHASAARLATSISPFAMVTHDAIFTEVLAYFCDDGASARRNASERVREALRLPQTVPVDRLLFLTGLDRYASRADKAWSHVDCMSMVLMEQRGIRHVLTNDHHFAQAGFVVVNE